MKHKEFVMKKKEEEHELQVKSMQERMNREEEIKKEKAELIRIRFERRKEMVNAENQHKKKIQSEYLRFLSSQKRPLHESMEERYEKMKMEDQKIKYNKMKELME